MFFRILFLFCLLPCFEVVHAQNKWHLFDHAMKEFMTDTQCTHAVISFCAINAKNGKVLYQINPNEKLAPASTLKTFTTAAALEYLGPDFHYTTELAFQGYIQDSVAYGELCISGNGDPTFGSDRFEGPAFFTHLDQAMKRNGIQSFHGQIIFRDAMSHYSACSRYWLEEDYGNYYGAGVYNVNWRENKFDITLRPSSEGFVVSDNKGGLNNERDFCIQLIPREGSGTEEAFAYVSHEGSCKYVLKGFLTPFKGEQTLSLATLNPTNYFIHDFKNYYGRRFVEEEPLLVKKARRIQLLRLNSPSLKEMVIACNQKSLNLYAETFCKSLGYRNYGKRSWKEGILVMLDFAKLLKVNVGAISLKDGSGLSPQNRMSTKTLAELLYRYKTKSWFPTFYESLPIINQIHMKSGYIGGTRSYTGYLNWPSGEEISFAFIVHGFEGSPRTVKEKMFKVLDTLKP